MWKNMDTSYHKIKRIPVSFFTARGKDYLTEEETNELLSGTFVIEEKLDGKTNGFDMGRYIYWYEDLKVRHTIFYNRLPHWKIIFDVWDKEKKTLLNHEEKSILLRSIGYEEFLVPLLDVVRIRLPSTGDIIAKRWLEQKSKLGDSLIEGIVVKNYGKCLMGKIVNPAFEEDVDSGVHPIKRRRQKYNMLLRRR